MLVLVLAVWAYARQMLTTRWAIGAAVLCSWYFATNYLFILGFFSFQWGVAAAFLALAAREARREISEAARSRRSRFQRTVKTPVFTRAGGKGVYIVACVCCYGAHLACFAMLATITGVTGVVRTLRKEQTWARFAADWSPFVGLAAYHVLVLRAQVPSATIARSTLKDKFGHFIEAFFVRQNYVVDRSILVLFCLIVVYAMWRRRIDIGRHWELATTCGLAATIYFALPFGLAGISYVDERSLPFFFIPLLILALRIFEESQPGKQVGGLILACALLAAANFGSLAWFLPAQNREAALYKEALLTIPPGKNVLPVDTRQRSGNTYPLRHVGSFYVAERGGYVPYLFSQANASGPAGYFTDLSTIYRPSQDWYLNHAEADWDKVTQAYDYVVVTRPWEAGRVDLRGLELYYQNSVATVFRVRR